MDATSTFGQWLKQRRQSLDLTQEALAEAIHCSVDLIRKIESGRRRPSRQVAALLAQHLRVAPEESAAFLRLARGSGPDVSGDPGAGADADAQAAQAPEGAARPVSSASTWLPAAPTRLIGREHELAHVRDLLWRSTTRMVTLTGPPGIGKTRLALAAAAALQDDFKDGLAFVSLASLEDPALVPVNLASALGIRQQGKRPLVEALQDALREKQMLLVLDNFEQVVQAAPVITTLLEAAPQLKVLVTSRAPLHLRGEKLVSVPPLTLPNLDSLPPLSDLADVESVALFVERAQDANDGFVLTPENAHLVAAICDQLDGLPLAIELAAARTRLFSLPALQVRLQSPLRILTGGPRDAPPHQQTLRRSIESSHALLSDREQSLFRRLGIFMGPFTFEAAEQVAGAGPDELEAILDQSLLRRQTGWEGEDDEVRFSMLASIREYAREQMEAHGEVGEIAYRHAQHYLALAVAALPEIATASQKFWLDRLTASYGDLRSAFDWAVRNGKFALALEMAGSLWRYWYARGEFSEGRRWLAEALEHGGDQPAELRALALHGIGTLAERQGDLGAAERYLLECIALREQLGDKGDLASSINNIGTVYYSQGHTDKAEASYQEATALYREIGDRDNTARTLGNVSMIYYSRGDYAATISVLEETLAMRRELRIVASVASALNNLGLVTLLVGDYERAVAYSEEALALDTELGDTIGIAFSLANLGHASRKLGNYERAQSALAESLALFRKMGDIRNAAGCLHRLAAVAAWSGHPAKAARLFGAAEAAREAAGAPVDPAERADYEESTTLTRDRLSEVEFKSAWSVGRSMSIDEAEAYARG